MTRNQRLRAEALAKDAVVVKQNAERVSALHKLLGAPSLKPADDIPALRTMLEEQLTTLHAAKATLGMGGLTQLDVFDVMRLIGQPNWDALPQGTGGTGVPYLARIIVPDPIDGAFAYLRAAPDGQVSQEERRREPTAAASFLPSSAEWPIEPAGTPGGITPDAFWASLSDHEKETVLRAAGVAGTLGLLAFAIGCTGGTKSTRAYANRPDVHDIVKAMWPIFPALRRAGYDLPE